MKPFTRWMMLGILLLATGADGFAQADPSGLFERARPVWAADRDSEMNLILGFRGGFDRPEESSRATLKVACSLYYRAWVNGTYVGHGPARAGHGWFRVDKWDISDFVRPGRNVVAVEVNSPAVNGFGVMDQPGFLQAEVAYDGKVVLATGDDPRGFIARQVTERVQRVQRYSFQRGFMEAYRLRPGWDQWRISEDGPMEPAVTLSEVPAKKLLARGIPLPAMEKSYAVRVVSEGRAEPDEPMQYWKDHTLARGVSEKWKGYAPDALEEAYSLTAQRFRYTASAAADHSIDANTSLTLDDHGYLILDLGRNLTGFLGLNVTCEKPMRLYAFFDEDLFDGEVQWTRLGCNNLVVWDLEPGAYVLESMEPNGMRYVKLLAAGGACDLSGVFLRRYENGGLGRARFEASDPRLNDLFQAAVATFAQNAVDIFMDCPHRERAGWLCDSFFTARTAFYLCGDAAVERNFLENFALPESFARLPEGMLPMCYPADHYDGVFIPNWAMWFVIQLDEYVGRSRDRALAEQLKPRVEALLKWLEQHENRDGLLEKLPGWVFVEWSKANEFVQDVNYPSNMLYAGMLDAAYRLYGQEAWRDKAARVRETVRAQSLKERFFADNAVRKEDGSLEVTQNYSEVCQYFAFFFGVADKARDFGLWQILMEDFGPKRQERGLWPEVHPANMFIGNMLRMELLSREGRSGQILQESMDYLMAMVRRTGTLWENMQDTASLNHGFASHTAVTLFRDILGVRMINPRARVVRIVLPDAPLESCRGEVPCGDGTVSLSWERSGRTITYGASVPEGFRLMVTAMPGLEAVAAGN